MPEYCHVSTAVYGSMALMMPPSTEQNRTQTCPSSLPMTVLHLYCRRCAGAPAAHGGAAMAMAQMMLPSPNRAGSTFSRLAHDRTAAAAQEYRLYTVVPRLLAFVEALTNVYVRYNRDRLKGRGGAEDCLTALQTLFGVLLQTCEVGAAAEHCLCMPSLCPAMRQHTNC